MENFEVIKGDLVGVFIEEVGFEDGVVTEVGDIELGVLINQGLVKVKKSDIFMNWSFNQRLDNILENLQPKF